MSTRTKTARSGDGTLAMPTAVAGRGDLARKATAGVNLDASPR